MRIFLSGLFCMVFFADAYADCGGDRYNTAEVTLEQISAPLTDAKGKVYNGCLLHAGGNVLGYAREDALCHAAPGQKVKVVLAHDGCCDTGPDNGDLECIVRSGAAHGNGMSVYSVASP